MSKNKVDKSLTQKEKLVLDCNDVIESNGNISYLVVGIEKPDGTREVIINSQGLSEKVKYYKEAYNDDLVLKTCDLIRIIDWMVV